MSHRDGRAGMGTPAHRISAGRCKFLPQPGEGTGFQGGLWQGTDHLASPLPVLAPHSLLLSRKNTETNEMGYHFYHCYIFGFTSAVNVSGLYSERDFTLNEGSSPQIS